MSNVCSSTVDIDDSGALKFLIERRNALNAFVSELRRGVGCLDEASEGRKILEPAIATLQRRAWNRDVRDAERIYGDETIHFVLGFFSSKELMLSDDR